MSARRPRAVAPRSRAPPARAAAAPNSGTSLKTREGAELRDGIAGFYDASTPVWDNVWGEHLHHGYYAGGKPRKDHQQAQARACERSARATAALTRSAAVSAAWRTRNCPLVFLRVPRGARALLSTRALACPRARLTACVPRAQVDMVDNVLEWSGAHAHGVDSVLDVGCGIGGSTRHIARKYGAVGTGITLSPVQVGIAQERTRAAGLSNVSFQVADALNMPFQADSFGLVWSLESGEVRACAGRGDAPCVAAMLCAPQPRR